MDLFHQMKKKRWKMAMILRMKMMTSTDNTLLLYHAYGFDYILPLMTPIILPVFNVYDRANIHLWMFTCI